MHSDVVLWHFNIDSSNLRSRSLGSHRHCMSGDALIVTNRCQETVARLRLAAVTFQLAVNHSDIALL